MKNSKLKSDSRYAVILAGGDGSRLKSLTKVISGDDRPKQFCPILGGKSLLDATRDRVRLSIPVENTFFSLTEKHERFFQAALWDVPESRLVVQPENRGTAPAILYSLMRIAAVDPNAVVAFFSSDHFFTDDERFMQQVDSAFRAVEIDSDSVLLLGLEPDSPKIVGWIERQLVLRANGWSSPSLIWKTDTQGPKQMARCLGTFLWSNPNPLGF